MGSLLALNQFDWADYEKADKSEQRKTVGYWIDKYEADFFERRGRTPESEVNWRKDYMRALNRLERDAVLTISLLRRAIISTEANSYTRQNVTGVLVRFGKFAGLEEAEKLSSLRGSYSARRVEPRDVPEDELILEHWEGSKDK